ncbi:MAG: DUF2007 domain-containing protein [Salinisphaeraceae bacterium]|nr:DUF2007 domain-containing protein [Salinisphaeraceae bacterium]
MSPEDWVTLRDNLEPTEAHILKARLAAEGISCHLHGEQHVQMDWSVAIALGGVRLQVAASDEATARKILIAVERGDYALNEGEDLTE